MNEYRNFRVVVELLVEDVTEETMRKIAAELDGQDIDVRLEGDVEYFASVERVEPFTEDSHGE